MPPAFASRFGRPEKDARLPPKSSPNFPEDWLIARPRSRRPLDSSLVVEGPSDGRRASILPYTATTPSAALTELAIAAGKYSRFNVDPAFPREKFQAMYRLWIERSVRGELADAVLVAATDPTDNEEQVQSDPAGMITVAESGGVAQIGLIAVAGTMRGRGIGSALIDAAHRWMQSRGACEARVVTQLDNLPGLPSLRAGRLPTVARAETCITSGCASRFAPVELL